MTDAVADINAAERRAAAAKERLTDDLHRLQAKLNPKTLARDAARSAADKGQSAATSSLDYARANPAPVIGAIAATSLFLLRHRIVALFRRNKKLTVPAQAKGPSRAADATPSDQGSEA